MSLGCQFRPIHPIKEMHPDSENSDLGFFGPRLATDLMLVDQFRPSAVVDNMANRFKRGLNLGNCVYGLCT